MNINVIDVEITDNATKKAKKYQIKKKLDKQIGFLRKNPRHNSLKLQNFKEVPGVWKFRVDKRYWGLVVKTGKNKLKIYDVIKHPA